MVNNSVDNSQKPNKGEGQKVGVKHHYITIKIKNAVFQQTMDLVRNHLKKPEKVFSKFIHYSFIDTVSRVAEASILRPNQVLAGSLTSIIAGFLLFVMASTYGFVFTPMALIFLYVVGYIASLFIETVINIIKSKQN